MIYGNRVLVQNNLIINLKNNHFLFVFFRSENIPFISS